MNKAEIKVEKIFLRESTDLHNFYGRLDENIKLLEGSFPVKIKARGNIIFIEGEPGSVDKVKKLLEEFDLLSAEGYKLKGEDFKSAIRHYTNQDEGEFRDIVLEGINLTKKTITPKSARQRDFIEAIKTHTLTIGIGPAGTGKTYLAVAMGVYFMQNKLVERIILTRPAIEAGEKLGFLPGDIIQKVDPYLRPLYDALYDMLGVEKVARYLERGKIEIAPLAFMRGRTLNDSFIILDEAQNTTSEQMKMFLTRLGNNSKATVIGDITQIDLPYGKISGLVEVQAILAGIEDIAFVYFTQKDVIRHKLVQEIVKAYEKHHNASSKRNEGKDNQS